MTIKKTGDWIVMSHGGLYKIKNLPSIFSKERLATYKEIKEWKALTGEN